MTCILIGGDMPAAFLDRTEAGQLLAQNLTAYAGDPDVIVLALPRGGVPVGYEVAHALGAPLDVLLVRKLGVPGQPELAMGAIASGDIRVLNEDVIRSVGVTADVIDRVAEKEAAELSRREVAYRGDRPPLDVRGHTVILVDDGLATGATMRAAAAGIRQKGPKRVVVAVPVAAHGTCVELARTVDEVICPVTPEPFMAVGAWYERFEQTTDDEVRELMARSALRAAVTERAVEVPSGDSLLNGDLALPRNPVGMVLFAHGSGSSRHSRRNRYVAGELQAAGLGTLLLDLLTAEEEAIDQRTRHLRFDITLLGRRLVDAVDWLRGRAETADLPIGTFGSSTGAAAALIAAAERPDAVRAVVSRGGRPDLAADALTDVRAATLLIVGERDAPVIPLNEAAYARIPGEKQLVLVPGAEHLFEEPGALESVAQLASEWFRSHLAP